MELNNRKGRRNLIKMLRKPTKITKPYHRLAKRAIEALQGTIGMGVGRTYGLPTRKSLGRLITWN